jgi:hypothetical protein
VQFELTNRLMVDRRCIALAELRTAAAAVAVAAAAAGLHAPSTSTQMTASFATCLFHSTRKASSQSHPSCLICE